MRILRSLALLAVLAGSAFAQNGTFKIVRASDVVVTPTLPTKCPPGRIFIKTGASSGLYVCVTRDTPVASGTGGSIAGITVDADGTVKASVALAFAAPTTPTYNAGGTTTCDLSLSNYCIPTAIATSATTLALTKPHGGVFAAITFTQPSSSPVANAITYPGTMANCPQPSPTASKTTTIFFLWTGAAYRCLGSDDTLDASPTAGQAAFTAQSDGATITWAIGSVLIANASVTLGGNRTLNVTGMLNGGSYVFKPTQDGTGTRTLTPGTGCTWLVLGGTGGGTFPLSTAANAKDVIAWTYDGTNCLATVGKAYAAP